MLTCIACSKQLEDGDEDIARETPSTKEAVKSLTSQIKDMVLKFSGVYRQCKPSSTSSSTSSSHCSKPQPHHFSSYVGEYSDGFDPTRVQELGSGRFKRSNKGTGEPTRVGGTKANQYEVWSHGVENTREEVGGVEAPTIVVEEEYMEAKEWVAQVEPGVHITFLALPQGGNDLRRIRFSREMFNKWQAQRWWGENYDKIMELYNVQRFNRQALPTPPRSEDERGSPYSRVGSTQESPVTTPWAKDIPSTTNTTAANSRAPTATSTTAEANRMMMMFSKQQSDIATAKTMHPHNPSSGLVGSAIASAAAIAAKGEVASGDPSRTTSSSRDEASISASDVDANEWVEQDEPGVYITVRQLPDGTRELRRVRFSRERFGEVHAKLWWEENRERIHAQYL